MTLDEITAAIGRERNKFAEFERERHFRSERGEGKRGGLTAKERGSHE